MKRARQQAEVRQDQILEIAERMFLERGYEDTPIQAIIDAAGIAKGTFYHHYPSKAAVLDGVLHRMTDRILVGIRAILDAPDVDAITKLSLAFSRSGAYKTEHRAVMIQMHRALRADSNAALYARMVRESTAIMLPLLTRVIEQGVAEGAFRTVWPRSAARLLIEMSTAMGNLVGDAILHDGPPTITADELEHEVAAYHEAVHRLLGAPPGSLTLYDADQLRLWLETASHLPTHGERP